MLRHWKTAMVVGVAVIAAAAASVSMRSRQAVVTTFEVRRGVFELALKTEGELQAAEKHSVMSPFSGELLRIHHAGEHVDAGTVIVEMNTDRINDAIEAGESQLRELEANRIKVEESVAQRINSAKLAIKRAGVELRLAKLRRDEVEAGPSAEDILDTERNLSSAEIIVKNRTEELGIIEILARKGLVSAQEVEKKRLELVQSTSSFEKAKARFATVSAGSTESKREDAALKVRIGEIELERARKHLDSLGELTKSQVEKARIAEDRKKRDVEEERGNLKKSTVGAPVAGIVQVGQRGRWHRRKWRQGDWAWEYARLITIPTIRKMTLTGKVAEDDVPLVKEGQEVRVRLPYLPGRVLKGTVTRTAPLGRDAHADFGERTRDKIGEAERQVFDVDMALEEVDIDLMPGIRANAEIVVYRNESALYVPASALKRSDGTDIVEVLSDGTVSQREVTVGRRGEVYVEITSGLDEAELAIFQKE